MDKLGRLKLVIFKREGLEMRTLDGLNLEEVAEDLEDDDTLGIYISKEEDFEADR
ncbi:MAG: hypothetical protein QXR65_05595 [Candidatus Bathyarchaeia archaeon]|nr:hypothetical protein [Candidatus Bathyarchaeota archaeon]